MLVRGPSVFGAPLIDILPVQTPTPNASPNANPNANPISQMIILFPRLWGHQRHSNPKRLANRITKY